MTSDFTDSTLPRDHERQLVRVHLSLDGLSIGDGFGAGLCWLGEDIEKAISEQQLPEPLWNWTDDTEMALSIAHILDRFGGIEQDELARSFAERFNSARMYGPAMYRELLPRLRQGANWRQAANQLFGGAGSLGNGAAMRVAPLGAYFADDLSRVVEEAELSAEVTHAHAEGIAGAIAVAVAAATAWLSRGLSPPRTPRDFLEMVVSHVPAGKVRDGIQSSIELSEDLAPQDAARILGNGSRVTALDTVPFAIWCAARYLDDFEEALWNVAGALGDIDTNCAIVGGIVALYVGRDGLPSHWLHCREPLPDWFLGAGD
jgi:ADP-ribosylglycohydrolase